MARGNSGGDRPVADPLYSPAHDRVAVYAARDSSGLETGSTESSRSKFASCFSNRNWNCIWTPGSLSSDVLAYGPLLCHDLADVPASGGISAEPQADFIRGYGRRLRHCIDCWTVADSKLVGVWSSDSHDDTWRLHVAARE